MATKLTTAQLTEKLAEQADRIDTLTTLVHTVVEAVAKQQQQPAAAAAKPAKQAKPWIQPCPDYASPAQRAEYDKLADRAAKQRKTVCEALGTESVSCFIPVAEDKRRMPHTVRWTARYSK